eukprot:SAG11_NODE_665_length_7847_cov_13.635132_5_plen_65_part_00
MRSVEAWTCALRPCMGKQHKLEQMERAHRESESRGNSFEERSVYVVSAEHYKTGQGDCVSSVVS